MTALHDDKRKLTGYSPKGTLKANPTILNGIEKTHTDLLRTFIFPYTDVLKRSSMQKADYDDD